LTNKKDNDDEYRPTPPPNDGEQRSMSPQSAPMQESELTVEDIACEFISGTHRNDINDNNVRSS